MEEVPSSPPDTKKREYFGKKSIVPRGLRHSQLIVGVVGGEGEVAGLLEISSGDEGNQLILVVDDGEFSWGERKSKISK